MAIADVVRRLGVLEADGSQARVDVAALQAEVGPLVEAKIPERMVRIETNLESVLQIVRWTFYGLSGVIITVTGGVALGVVKVALHLP